MLFVAWMRWWEWYVLPGVVKAASLKYYILFPREAHQEEWAAHHQNSNTAVPGDNTEFCLVRGIKFCVTLHPI